MTISEYQTLTGITVPATMTALVTAQLNRTQIMLEELLGYTLNADNLEDNQYTETGIINDGLCAYPADVADLDSPDAIVSAYRLYPYNEKDIFLSIDPATAIHAVKLVSGSVTYKVFDADEYRAHSEMGIIKYLEKTNHCWWECECYCQKNGFQLAVDADWAFTALPVALQLLQADMVTYYSNQKKDIKSETLGSHSYTKYDRGAIEYESANTSLLLKYAGPLGSIRKKIPTV